MRLQAILKPNCPSSRAAIAGASGLLLAAAVGTGLATAALAGELAPVGARARVETVKARYAGLDAAGYQRACASSDPVDEGYCAGVIFGVMPGQTSANPGNAICQPDKGDYVTFEKQARAAILAGDPLASETPNAFAVRVLRATFQCPATARLTSSGMEITADRSEVGSVQAIYTGSPTIRIVGPMPRQLLLVDGRKPDPDFDVNALPRGAIARITMSKADSREARALGAAPGQSVLNIELKQL